MTFLVKKLHSQSLPYGRNKLQLSVKPQNCKKKKKGPALLFYPQLTSRNKGGKERGKRRREIL